MFLLVPAYPGCPGQTAVKWLFLLLLSYFTCPPRGPEKCYHCTLFKTDVINCYTTWHWNVRKSKIAETVKVSTICVHQTLEKFGWFLNEIFKKYKGDVFIGAQCSMHYAACRCLLLLLCEASGGAWRRRRRTPSAASQQVWGDSSRHRRRSCKLLNISFTAIACLTATWLSTSSPEPPRLGHRWFAIQWPTHPGLSIINLYCRAIVCGWCQTN